MAERRRQPREAELRLSLGALHRPRAHAIERHRRGQRLPRVAGPGERGILAEIRRIQANGVTPEELARSITASEAQREFSQETVEGLALAYGRAEITWSLEAERAYLDRVRAVTAAQVQEAARRYLTDAYARLAFVPRGRAQ